MTVRRLSPAEEEYIASVAFYVAESPQAADGFADEVESAIDEIAQSPTRYPIYEENVRRKVLDVFPFSIYYVTENDEVMIVAIMHNSRRPKYWRERL
ncbi:MAG: type II toxin-antitoxin system RelE/ParE family toxin [Bacteroidota bacterium]|nr:type II toxin-antitoxin system RelE/ParE family toxin [Bacteroidota bacterium]MDP4232501.1 type II toxin-antitoxin system RelE/ParE family toxin [Bacteroidota bacterium]MDP4286381.1 type II toxin-antitoxin system RelE/ParE family toxin [Bacteroidota bacterium]